MEWSGAEWDGMEQSGMGWDRIIAQYNERGGVGRATGLNPEFKNASNTRFSLPFFLLSPCASFLYTGFSTR